MNQEDIHPQAALSVNEKAEKIPPHVVAQQSERFKPNTGSSFGEIHTKSIDEKDILNFRQGIADYYGQPAGILFTHEGKTFEVAGENYSKVTEVIEAAYKIKAIRSQVSIATVTDFLHRWVEEKYLKKTDKAFVEYLCESITVKFHRIWLPIRFLQVERPFNLGHITIRMFTKADADRWAAQLIELGPTPEDARKFVDDNIREYQGYAVAEHEVTAEESHAVDVAISESRKSIEVLRAFSIANLTPRLYSRYNLWGEAHIDAFQSIHLNAKDHTIEGFSSGVFDKNPPTEVVTQHKLKENGMLGLGILDVVLRKDSPSQFEEEILNAVISYARSASQKRVPDKLVYIFSALESILIRSTEPIQQNLSDRMAFLCETSPENRKAVVSIVKKTYSVRSSFVHHGKTKSDLEELQAFMKHAWVCMTQIIGALAKFKTRDAFLDHLDHQKYS